MNQDWAYFLNPILTSPKLAELKTFIQNERKTKNIYPESRNVFKAFEICSIKDTKCVIIGSEPHNISGGAHGLSFSSLRESRSPELKIIFNEIYRDLNIQYDFNISQEEMFPSNDLTNWGNHGFLLLNRILTVVENETNSHAQKGWENITVAVIEALNQKDKPVIFLLWGDEAQSFRPLIKGNNIVLNASYPDTEAFYGCKHFSILRDILPEIHLSDERIVLDMTPFFKKSKAISYLKETYPHYADDAEKFIKQ